MVTVASLAQKWQAGLCLWLFVVLESLENHSHEYIVYAGTEYYKTTTQHARPPAARTTRYVVPHADEDDSIR
jgi:hypothetical protein